MHTNTCVVSVTVYWESFTEDFGFLIHKKTFAIYLNGKIQKAGEHPQPAAIHKLDTDFFSVPSENKGCLCDDVTGILLCVMQTCAYFQTELNPQYLLLPISIDVDA